MALDSLGRPEEALTAMQQAQEINPKNYDIRLQMAIVLDSLSRHSEAGSMYDDLKSDVIANFDRLMAAKPDAKITDETAQIGEAMLIAGPMRIPAALNLIFRAKWDQALAEFKFINERTGLVAKDDAEYAALWRVWLIAKLRTSQGAKQTTSIDTLVKSLKVYTPYHKAMLSYYQGTASWDDVLAAIESIKQSDAEKEGMLTEATFFGAGCLRYVKHDEQAALALLQAEDARPFNGCVERLLIRKEIASILKPQLSTAASNATLSISPAPDTVGNPQGVIITLPEGLSKDAVHQALITALNTRSWKVSQSDGNHVLASINSRGKTATISAQYDESKIITTVSSNLKNGQAPSNWIKNKHNDIMSELRKIIQAQ